MIKKQVQAFMIIGTASMVLGVMAYINIYVIQTGKLVRLFHGISEILFAILLLLVAADLKKNYAKKVWPIYLYACYLLLFTYVIFSNNMQNFYKPAAIARVVVSIVFIVFLWKTVYKLFAIIFLTVIIITAIVPLIFVYWLPHEWQQWLSISTLLPVFFPSALMYIVYIKSKDTTTTEIESIGMNVN